MKKCGVLAILFVLAAVLTGCPWLISQPVKQGVHIRLDLNTDADTEKGYGYPEIPLNHLRQVGDAFKSKAAYLELEFYPQSPIYGKMGGDVPPPGYRYESIPIVDGVAEKKVALNVGDYWLTSTVVDDRYNNLFDANETLTVEAGQVTEAEIEVDFMYQYDFRLQICDLPAEFGYNSQIRVIDLDGNSWYSQYAYPEDDCLQALVPLPLSFKGGSMVISDLDTGIEVLADLPLILYALDFNTYDLSSSYWVGYQPPTTAGQVEIEVSFAYQNRYVRVNGLDYNSIQEAIDSNDTPVEIQLGQGEYPGFTLGPDDGKIISITGQGAAKTSLIKPKGSPNVIYAELAVGKGGGAPTLSLNDLAVVSSYQSMMSMPVPGNLIQLSGMSLLAYNCVFENYDGFSVSVYYPQQVNVNRCVFWANSMPSLELNGYDGQSSMVYDSIFQSWANDYIAIMLPTFEQDGQIGTFNNCLMTGSPVHPEFEVPNWLIGQDPLLYWPGILDPASPCIGAGLQGHDIGLLWAE